ncbi:dihydrofolate reductase family protein [Amycolatopsis taiwanensis]|uniref:Bacterial bifunctional deaminase-reductase C-terminal domain-containing protein n=1 Tax=Amycolatopsis taiwanensis TaxID=342230 RepID=A0A9W6R1A1_9PSEU|nr:dihydrofolate reductase family protein [Amycolatopsis taiwanensis]GLY65757.1 hypothetical protein Atai01_23760 [Amycolatopsis taiwanensis]
MRKIYAFIAVSADGYHEGPDRELDWHVVDEEFNEFAIKQLHETGTLVFGRATYQMMASYWPTAEAKRDDPEVAALMNAVPKVVASRTLREAGWAGPVTGDAAGELTALKAQPGKDIGIFGSSTLTVDLLRAGVLDELRLMVMPVLLGDGHPALHGADRAGLTLTGARPFSSGNVLLTYRAR